MTDQIIRARFAPSPTGFLHIGGARTALFNWAFIEHFRRQNQKADFLLRIEDTDLQRNNNQAISEIIDAMKWLELDFHKPVIYQSKRIQQYQLAAQVLIDQGLAYKCYCSKEQLENLRQKQKFSGEKPHYNRRCYQSNQAPPSGISPVIRFKYPDQGVIHWFDLVKGNISIDNCEFDDFVIMRADGVPTYNFANVIDDNEYKITHIIRGDDHINNTPKQINLYLALGFKIPEFAHLPMIHGDDGEKLSKRHGAINVNEYLDQGFLPEALNNYLARLGFSHGNDEIFSKKDLASWFEWDKLQSSPARFDRHKLLWLNQQYIINADVERLFQLVLSTEKKEQIVIASQKCSIKKILELYQDRCQTICELSNHLAKFAKIDQDKTYTSDEIEIINNAKDVFQYLYKEFSKLSIDNWQSYNIQKIFKECLQTTNKKMPELGIPLRLAILGEKTSPSIDKIVAATNKNLFIEVIKKFI